MQLDLLTRTLFSEFQEIVFARTALENEIKNTDIYVRKKVKGKEYWYTQHYENGQAKQSYFGTRNKKNDSIVESERKKRKAKQSLLKKLLAQEQRQVGMLRKGGLPCLDSRFANVISKLSENRLIDHEGVLIGSVAFQVYSGMLGSLFEKNTLKTNDIDIFCDSNIKIATTKLIDINKVISEMNIDFHEVPGFSKKSIPSSYVSKDGIRLDFITNQKGKPKGVVPIPRIKGVGAVEIPFIDFLISGTERSVLLGPKGGIPVMVPSPEYFAIHKLITATRRPATENSKTKKDIMQAEQLIEVLALERPAELRTAIRRAKKYSKKAEKYLKSSLKLLSKDSQKYF